MNAPKLYQKTGNIPAVRITFFAVQDTKPVVSPPEGWRVSFLRHKVEKALNQLRQNFAVQVRKLHASGFSAEFTQALYDEVQDSYIKQSADGEFPFESCEDASAIEKDYMDSSRIGGKRVKEADVSLWFEANVSEYLSSRIVEKYKNWDADKVSALVGQYQKSFGELAKISLPQSLATSKMLSKVWNEFKGELPEELSDDPMVEYITTRVEKLEARHKNAEDLMAAI